MGTEVVSKVFAYNGSNVTFARKNNLTMVNATQMAKPFGDSKRPKNWLGLKSTDELLSAISEGKILPSADLVKVTKGGNGEQGTWMQEDVALAFAQWLSPKFYVWCNDRIKELLTIGMTATQPTLEAMLDNPDLVIGLATKLKQQREENQRLITENKQKQALITQQSKKIEEDAPKVEHHDIFMNAEHGNKDVSVRKFIAQAGIRGEKKFWDWMEHERKLIYRDSKDRPMPYAGKYRHFFAMPDKHNKKNNWSGTQLMITPLGKVGLAKMYFKDHSEDFYDNSKIKQLELFNN